jgi:hypothetical protein
MVGRIFISNMMMLFKYEYSENTAILVFLSMASGSYVLKQRIDEWRKRAALGKNDKQTQEDQHYQDRQ